MKYRTCRIRKSARALSPVISILLMIAIVVAASLVVYLWVNNYIGFTTSRVGEEIQIQSLARDPLSGNLVIYLQNTGQGTVILDPTGSVYIDGKPEPSIIAPATLSVGQTSTITTTHQIMTDAPMTVKIVTKDGISTQRTTNTGFFAIPSKNPECQILFAKGTGGSASTPSDSHYYSVGARIPVFASADNGYAFSRWAANTSQIVFDEPASASTWATINGNGTIIAAFTQIRYIVTFTMGQGGATLNPSGTQAYPLGKTVSITTSAANGYTFESWTTTGQVAVDNANSASTIATVNGAGTVTASFSQNQFSVEFTNNGEGTTNPSGTHTYNRGQQVAITGNPDAGSGYIFSSWTTTGSIDILNPNAATTTATINSPGKIMANFNLQTKPTPILSCTPDQNTIIQGHAVTITGALTYSGQGLTKTITISYSLPGQTPTTHNMVTDALGGYTDSFIPSKPGQMVVQASFAGDSSYNPASSAPQTIIVTPPTPIDITFQINGMDPDTETATIVSVDLTNYTYYEIQTHSFSWIPGSTHIIVASTPIATSSEYKQYVWINWEAQSFGTYTTSTYTYTTPDSTEAINVSFVPQTQILFAYYDVYETYTESDPTVTYYNGGVQTTIQATRYGSETVWADVDSTYTYPTNLQTTQTNMQWQTPNPTDIIQQYNDWIQPFYYGQYKISLNYAVVGGGTPEPPTLTAYQLGYVQDLTLTNTPTEYWIDDFYYATTPNLQDSIGNPDETWQLSQPTDGYVSDLQPAATFTYHHQFMLTVITNPVDLSANFQITYTQYQTVIINQLQTTTWYEWVDATATVNISNPQPQLGTHTYQNTTPSPIIIMNQPQTITLNYS